MIQLIANNYFRKIQPAPDLIAHNAGLKDLHLRIYDRVTQVHDALLIIKAPDNRIYIGEHRIHIDDGVSNIISRGKMVKCGTRL